MKNILVVAIALLFSVSAQAQIKSAELQVSGLTCSMCNLSVKKSLEKISFIKSVKPNVETATYQITFAENSAVQLTDLQSAVKKAGFSVAKLTFIGKVNAPNSDELTIAGNTYNVVTAKTKSLNGDVAFQVVDKGFLSDKEFKKYQAKLKTSTEKRIMNIVQL